MGFGFWIPFMMHGCYRGEIWHNIIWGLFFQNEQLAVSAWGYEQNMLSGRGFCCLYRFDSDRCHYHKTFSQCITTALSVFWLVGDIVLWITGAFCCKTAVTMDQRWYLCLDLLHLLYYFTDFPVPDVHAYCIGEWMADFVESRSWLLSVDAKLDDGQEA